MDVLEGVPDTVVASDADVLAGVPDANDDAAMEAAEEAA